MNTPTLMGHDTLSHQHYLRQVSQLANERAYSPREVMQRFPDVEARYTDVHADYVQLKFKGMKVIEGDTVFTYRVDNEGLLNVRFSLKAEFERALQGE